MPTRTINPNLDHLSQLYAASRLRHPRHPGLTRAEFARVQIRMRRHLLWLAGAAIGALGWYLLLV